MEGLNKKLYNNITPGQGIISINKNFDIQINKVSSINPKNIFVDLYDCDKKKRKNKVRHLNTICQHNPIMDINKENITNLIKNENSDNIGFNSHLYKNKNLPVVTNSTRKIFSENSLNFTISTEKGKKQKNIDLMEEGKKIYFEMRFDIPQGKNETEMITDTACVQYDEDKNPGVTCESWYDIHSSQVVCSCEKYGLTVNVYDKALSNMNKLSQFPIFDSETCILIIY
jgi:hypothetical protein